MCNKEKQDCTEARKSVFVIESKRQKLGLMLEVESENDVEMQIPVETLAKVRCVREYPV